jgi:hypothetical protein
MIWRQIVKSLTPNRELSLRLYTNSYCTTTCPPGGKQIRNTHQGPDKDVQYSVHVRELT